jgi:dolichol-phosphate mannosyltransferase
VEGWISTMGFLALGFFGVFALLTIILKYLSVVLNLIFKQQRYLIADIEKVASH